MSAGPEHEEQGRPVSPPRNLPHWTGWLLLISGVFTLPWTANLAAVLPDKSEAAHYNTSWVGFDLLLCALLIRTGWSLLRGRAYAEVTAAMTAVMLFVDAWFDVLSAPTTARFAVALTLALCAEVPMSIFCLWVSVRAEYERRRREEVMSATVRRLLELNRRRSEFTASAFGHTRRTRNRPATPGRPTEQATEVTRVTSQEHEARHQPDLLSIYLNDHLAGATGGVELARRLASNFKRSPHGQALQRIASDVEQDRNSLLDVMRRLDVPVNHLKVGAGWLGEKLGRLKPNGHLLQRSPLSSLVELEAMSLGVQGKAAGWRVLRAESGRYRSLDRDEFDELLSRASTQAQTLEAIRQDVAERAFARR